jgi:hypothetical protein
MTEYILFMHDDTTGPTSDAAWERYFEFLGSTGAFEGGSSIGGGTCARRDGAPRELTPRIAGFIRVRAQSLDDARRFLDGNPVYETGGTVEIRELPRD